MHFAGFIRVRALAHHVSSLARAQLLGARVFGSRFPTRHFVLTNCWSFFRGIIFPTRNYFFPESSLLNHEIVFPLLFFLLDDCLVGTFLLVFSESFPCSESEGQRTDVANTRV